MNKNLLERAKGYIGILFILIAIGGIFFWEKYGRVKLLYKQEIVFVRDIPANTIITKEDLTTVAIEKNRLVDKRILNADEIIGKESKIFIPKNAQLHDSYFDDPEVVLNKDQFIFPIPEDWIKAVPDTLRRKDTIYFYEYKETNKLNIAEITKQAPSGATDVVQSLENKQPIAKFKVAYVKDATNREVVDAGDVERKNATSKIQKIELLATAEEVKLLEKSYKNGNKFILMYK